MCIGIIGVGIVGLASVVWMVVQGYEVEVFEVNDYFGGKLLQFDLQGYCFDVGLLFFIMLQYVDDFFWLVGEDFLEYF